MLSETWVTRRGSFEKPERVLHPDFDAVDLYHLIQGAKAYVMICHRIYAPRNLGAAVMLRQIHAIDHPKDI
eukprot:2826660-Pyramimonas_sp.AAC.1